MVCRTQGHPGQGRYDTRVLYNSMKFCEIRDNLINSFKQKMNFLIFDQISASKSVLYRRKTELFTGVH